MIKYLRKAYKWVKSVASFFNTKSSTYRRGRRGELMVKKLLQKQGYSRCILHDLIIQNKYTNTHAQVDLVMVTRRAIYVIEVKSYNCHTISGHIDEPKWKIRYGKSSTMVCNNIYYQIFRQMEAIESQLRLHNISVPVYGIIHINSKYPVSINIEGHMPNRVTFSTDINKLIQMLPKHVMLFPLVSNLLLNENKRNSYIRNWKKTQNA